MTQANSTASESIRIHLVDGVSGPACPFQPACDLELGLAEGFATAELVHFKPGLSLLRIRVAEDAPVLPRLDFGGNYLLTGFIHSGSAVFHFSNGHRHAGNIHEWFQFHCESLEIEGHRGQKLEWAGLLCTDEALSSLLAIEHPGGTPAEIQSNGSISGGVLNTGQRELAHQIIRLPAQGLGSRLHLEGTSLTWLAEQLFRPTGSQNVPAINAQDRDTLEDVAAYLGDTLDADHSIASLALRFGLNESKLKQGFKSQFERTVFGYLRELRMERAKSFLRQDRMSVIEVANAVGYSNASHFARAFKEHTGLLPKGFQCLHRAR
ncbi:helix-turn-helix transcriptional regulator [Coraliomargarita parva]|uniref:helix-turn-helix transcriptional regulator n=1 Tax=Coraliomargarita parva TaxID=3014050 RepID=UPI0022B5663B|nr:AraC family transcriptional regulator [Coraliomargarita parva]